MSPGRIRDKQNARWRAVEDHIRCEAAHDLDALVDTFGANAEWHNKPSNDVLHGHDAIRSFYGDLFAGFPDFWLDIRNRRTADDAIIVDGLFGGTHAGEWMGIAAHGQEGVRPILRCVHVHGGRHDQVGDRLLRPAHDPGATWRACFLALRAGCLKTISCSAEGFE